MLSLSDPAAKPTIAERDSVRRSLGFNAVWIMAIAVGGTVGRDQPVSHMEPALRHLILLMAVLKSAMTVASALLVEWRLKSEIRLPLTCGYAAAVALMAAAQAMMWHPVHLIVAGTLFHTGLLLFLGVAYVDRGAGALMADTWKTRRAAWKRGYL